MNSNSVNRPIGVRDAVSETALDWAPHSLAHKAMAAGAVAVGYYVASELGLALLFPTTPVSALWPANAFLLAVLLTTPRRCWWMYLLAAFPTHLLANAPLGVPLSIMCIQFAGNTGLALLGALATLHVVDEPRRFDRLRAVTLFMILAGLLAPALVGFPVATLFVLLGWSQDFWLTWRVRILNNALAIFTLTPLIVLALTKARTGLAVPSLRRSGEAGALLTGLLAVGFLVFVRPSAGPEQSPALLYAPLPLLLWAAVRFGLGGVCLSVLMLGALSLWGAIRGQGPFAAQLPVQNVMALNLFLLVTCAPLLMLAALLEERKQAGQALRASEAKFRSIFESNILPTAIWHADGRISEANDAYLHFTGFTRAELEAGHLRWYVLTPPDSRQSDIQALKELVATGKCTPREKEFRLRDGRRVPIMVGGGVFPGSIDQGVAYVLDLSHLKRAEEKRWRAERLHRSVLASLQDHVAIIDRDGVILGVNDSWTHFVRDSGVERFDRVLAGAN